MTWFDKVTISVCLVSLILYWSADHEGLEVKKLFAFIAGLSILTITARLPWIVF